MKNISKWIVTMLLTGLVINSNAQQPSSTIIAITDVNIIPMDSERIIEHQTILIKGNKIVKIGLFSKVKIPSSARVINGENKFLIPGLIDMHVHLSKEDLPLFIARGVTTVRNMNGDSTHLELRNKINQGILDGPRIFTSGPLITVPQIPWKIKVVPTSPDDVRKIVRTQKMMGFDYIKVYEGLTVDIYDALMDEAKKMNIPVVGHIPKAVGMEHALEKKQASIEHAEQIVYSYFNFQFDTSKITTAARLIKDAGAWVCPTLAVQEIFKLNGQGDFLPMLNNSEMAYVDAGTMSWWKSFATPSKDADVSKHQQRARDFYGFQLKLTKGLFDAGVPLLAGTDEPNPGMVPGFSLHDELRNLVAAGLSPYEALKCATANAALFLKKEKQFGTIKEGMTADLVLLENNPLADIANTKLQTGVMVRGTWFSDKDIKELLAGYLKPK